VADPYSDVVNADQDFLDLHSEILELRAAHPRQVEMRDRYFADIDFGAGSVLEVGCGTGAVTDALAARPDVSTADPSPHFIELARKRDTRATFDLGDAYALEYEDDSFDVVVFHTVLCHLPEPDVAIAEAVRVVRPGGQVAVFDGDYCSTTLSLSPDDPLAPCAREYMASNCYDLWFMRSCPSRLRGAGLEIVSSMLHGFTDPDDFLPFAERAVDLYRELGKTTDEGARALLHEVARRYEAGEFYGHMLYASVVAGKPTAV
jgi:ubiquinone/menaquinone biosynthesis C-methylase UbiE